MNGIELSKAFWDEYGNALLEGLPADVLARVAVGLAGQGSECFGFDDELSRDHDFEPGFRLWMDDGDHERWGMELQRRQAEEAAERYLNVLDSRYKTVPNRQKKIKAVNALIARGFDRSLAEEVSQKLLPTSSKEEAKRLSADYNKAKQRYARKYRGYELKKRVVGSLLSKGYDYEDIKELTEEDSYEND